MGTPCFAVVVAEATRVDWAEKLMMSTPASFSTNFSQFAILCEVTGLWGCTYDSNNLSGLPGHLSLYSRVLSSYSPRQLMTQRSLSYGNPPKKRVRCGAPALRFLVNEGRVKVTREGEYAVNRKSNAASSEDLLASTSTMSMVNFNVSDLRETVVPNWLRC